MKKIVITSFAALLAAAAFTSCASSPKSKAGSKSEGKNRTVVVSDGYVKNLVEIVTIPAPDRNSAFEKVSAESPVDLMAFKMAQTETTYSKWYEVYSWALNNGYTFANPGREGSFGEDGAVPKGSAQPVTMISWRDAVVWCNALSEKEGLNPVYKFNGQVLKESDSAKDGEGKAENAIVDENADGYRLPTVAEWEFAARGGNPKSESWTRKFSISADSPENVAWYIDNSDGVTHDVQKKAANEFMVYDICGNVWEWCYNSWSSNIMRREMRGGSYRKIAEGVSVMSRDFAAVSKKYDDAGFRVVKAALSARDAK